MHYIKNMQTLHADAAQNPDHRATIKQGMPVYCYEQYAPHERTDVPSRHYRITGVREDGKVTAEYYRDGYGWRAVQNEQRLDALTLVHTGDFPPALRHLQTHGDEIRARLRGEAKKCRQC
jgi:hypothetical protein